MLQHLEKWFLAGLSDEAIAKHWASDPEMIWRLRTQYKFMRPNECPDCGCREFKEGVECPNNRCLSVWPKRWFEAQEIESRRRRK